MFQENYDEAWNLFEESLKMTKQLKDDEWMLRNLRDLAWVAQNQGNYQEAQKLCQQSLEMDKQLGNKKWIARNLYRLGQIAYNLKDYEQAFRNIRESIQMIKHLELDDQKMFQEQLEEVRKVLGKERAKMLEEELGKQQSINRK